MGSKSHKLRQQALIHKWHCGVCCYPACSLKTHSEWRCRACSDRSSEGTSHPPLLCSTHKLSALPWALHGVTMEGWVFAWALEWVTLEEGHGVRWQGVTGPWMCRVLVSRMGVESLGLSIKLKVTAENKEILRGCPWLNDMALHWGKKKPSALISVRTGIGNSRRGLLGDHSQQQAV